MVQNNEFIEAIKKVNKLKKALIVGSGAVGKTSLLTFLSTNLIPATTYKRTSFVNFDTIRIHGVNHQEIIGQIQVQDLAGQITLPVHALKDFVQQTLGATDIIFLVFDNNNFQSFLDLEMWLNHINDGLKILNVKINPRIVLIRNKVDLEQVVEESLVKKLMEFDKRITHCFSISCVKGSGFEQLQSFLKEVFS